MRKIIIVATATCFALLSCSPSSEKKVETAVNDIKRDIKKEKDDTAQTLRVLRDNINDKLDKISREFDQARGNAKVELGEVKDLLIEQRAKAKKVLDGIDNSSETTWDDIQQGAKNTSNEVKIAFERMDERVTNALRNANK